MAKEYYSLENIKKTNAQYRILLGEKGNGKSYAVKSEVISDAYLHHRYFVYMRRYDRDIKNVDVMAYFSDAPVKKITHGYYDTITVDRGIIYLANYEEDEDGGTPKLVKGPKIGRSVCLNGYEHYASQAFPDTYNIIYEEFITKSIYLDKEPATLQKMVSTILRDRQGAVYLIGNTINRVCPYFTDWELKNTIKQEIGTIDIYKMHREGPDGEDIVTDIAVERCSSSKSTSKMFFGKTAEFLVKGEWEVYDRPKMPDGKFTMLYELILESQGFAFILQLMVGEDGGQFVYVYPFTYKRIIPRIITDRFSTSPFVTTTFNPKINAEVIMQKCIKDKKVCFSDNLTGSDFEQVLANRR